MNLQIEAYVNGKRLSTHAHAHTHTQGDSKLFSEPILKCQATEKAEEIYL